MHHYTTIRELDENLKTIVEYEVYKTHKNVQGLEDLDNAIKKIIVRNYSNEDAVDTWVLQKGTECFQLAKIGRKYRDVPLDTPRHAKIEGFLPYTTYAQETSSSSIEGGLKGPMSHDPGQLYVKLRYMDTDNRTNKALLRQIESI